MMSLMNNAFFSVTPAQAGVQVLVSMTQKTWIPVGVYLFEPEPQSRRPERSRRAGMTENGLSLHYSSNSMIS